MFFFFFNDTATTEIYTLSLHDALPIWPPGTEAASATVRLPTWPQRSAASRRRPPRCRRGCTTASSSPRHGSGSRRSEEHTSELQSRPHLVCRLLLAKKKKRRVSVSL